MHWLDPEHLPETCGTIDRLVYNEHGELDGFLLDGGREVHMPPHLGRRLVRELRAGSRVAVRGAKPRGADLVAAVKVTLEGGRSVEDAGPDGRPPPRPPASKPVHLRGRVQATLHAPRGEVAGGLLEDGSIVRMHPKGNEALAPYFAPGAEIEVWGDGFVKAGTRVVGLGEIALAEEARH